MIKSVSGDQNQAEKEKIMRLYKMELYKLYHRTSFFLWSVCAVLMLVFYFWVTMDCERTTIKGKTYYGYEAVKMNRQITKEYQGELTDEKISQIVREYGLPSEVVYDYPDWTDGNYLNGFVADYLSDGYMGDWTDYKAPEKVYAINDTQLGELQKATGKKIYFAYTNGWKIFFDILQMGMVFASVLVIFAISVVFAQEGQSGMLPLLFTAKEGKGKDIWAKIAAAFTLTIIVYMLTILLCFLLSFCVFGLEGAECPMCVALSRKISVRTMGELDSMAVGSYACVILKWNLIALLFLCAMTLCVSAHYRSLFGAVFMAAVVWGTPLLVGIFFGGFGYFFTSCMPVFLIMTNSVYESVSWGWEPIMLGLIIPLFFLCVGEGYRTYRMK